MKVLLEALRYGAIGLAAILAVLAYLLLRAEQDKTKPNQSILKTIRQFMLFALAIAFAGIAAEIINKQFAKPLAPPPPARSFVLVEKYTTPTPLVNDLYVLLLDIETLKGKPKKDSTGVLRGGHTFNKGLWRSNEVVARVLETARPVPAKTVQEVLALSDAGWVEYLDQQEEKRKRQVLDTAFARIRVLRGPVVLSEQWYFQNDRLDTGRDGKAWQVAHVFNTDAESGQKEAVILTNQ
jgi:hypothetical protein